MKVSIITCCYNRVDTIGRAIESVLNQTYPDIEYIIVDGGSTDGSREIINRYKDRVARVIFEPDRSMYEGINKGIRVAKGDVIALCHSDDYMYSPTTVEQMVALLEKTGADIGYADGMYMRRRDEDEPARIWKSGDCKKWKLRMGWLPLHTTCYIKKSVYDTFGLYDESFHIAADTKFLLNTLISGKVKTAYLPEFVTKMRMGGLSTDKARVQQMWNEDIRIFREAGVRPAHMAKVMKMGWKIPQYLRAKLKHYSE